MHEHMPVHLYVCVCVCVHVSVYVPWGSCEGPQDIRLGSLLPCGFQEMCLELKKDLVTDFIGLGLPSILLGSFGTDFEM